MKNESHCQFSIRKFERDRVQFGNIKGSRQPESRGVRNVSIWPNLSGTAAIDVLFSINFAVVFDFMYCRFRPSKAKWLGDVLTNGQNAANTCSVSFFEVILLVTKMLRIRLTSTTLPPLTYMNRCVNTKDGTVLSAPLYWRNDAPRAIRQCATILQRL